MTRIHELNGFSDPFADINDELVWSFLVDGNSDEHIGHVARALSEAQWAIIRRGQIWRTRKYLSLNGISVLEAQRWYKGLMEDPPPISYLQLGDKYSPWYDLDDPSQVIRTFETSLKALHICGDFHLSQSVTLTLDSLFLKTYSRIDGDWFAKSTISTKDVSLAIKGLDACAYLPILMNPRATSIEIYDATNNAAMLADLFTRPQAPNYLVVQNPEDDGSSGGQLAFDALMKASPSWKRCDFTFPMDLFEADAIDELYEAGFKITEQ